MSINNIILNTDSYKHSHFAQYPPRTKRVYSYIESRGGQYNYTIFFGLQMFIKEYLTHPISLDDIDEAEDIAKLHGIPFNRKGWDDIYHIHGGYLPIQIRAVPEGTRIGTHNVLVSVVNTDPDFAWVTSFVETALLRAIWYPTTVATVSHFIKIIIRQYLIETGDPSLLPFKLHDFGARGASSKETAGIGGLAHLVNFQGTDTMEALLYARRYYGEKMAGFSIPAAEHSTITSWGREHEQEAYENMIAQFGGEGKIYAVVSDSYDIYNAVEKIWGENLRRQVIEKGGTVVIRPDSGNPVEVVTKVIELLGHKFGFTLNSKGYKVLPPYVRIIQGDGVNPDSIADILKSLRDNGYSADNIAFGMGGALLQKMDRDTLKFAMKASAVQIDYTWRDVFKEPVTDPGKKSKKGLVETVFQNGKFTTVNLLENPKPADERAMRTVFENGRLLIDEKLSVIRDRANL